MSKIMIEGNPSFKKEKPQTDYLNVAEFFCDTIQGENFVGYPATFLRLQSCTQACIWCFHPNTNIVTVNGSPKKISELIEGEMIYTLDESGSIVETKIDRVIRSVVSVDEIIGLRFSHTNIYVTKNHPFYVKNIGWVEAEKLQVGDIILGPTSKQLVHYHKSKYNNQKINFSLQKRKSTQKKLRELGVIKPYIRSDEWRKNMSEQKKENNPMRDDPEVARRNYEAHSLFKMSKLEQQFLEKFESFKFDIEYIGSGKTRKAIGNKLLRYRFPDFIVSDTKKLIEVYNTTYHYTINGTFDRATRGYDWRTRTQQHYSTCGYEVLFLTEQDLLDDEKLHRKLFNYIFNGEELLEVIVPSTKIKAALFGSSFKNETEVYNLSCSPYNTYLVHDLYHHKLVHNCDTLEVWRYGNPYTFNELFELIEKFDLVRKFKEGQRLVLTGGSPVLQQDSVVKFIQEFIKRYKFKPYIEIENECTLMPHDQLVNIVDLWNNSPKLSDSGNADFIRYQPRVLSYLSSLKNAWFKFVVSKEEDWEEIKSDFLDTNLIRKDQIVLMPLGATRQELIENREKVVEIAIRENVRYTTREHVIIWDRKTGI